MTPRQCGKNSSVPERSFNFLKKSSLAQLAERTTVNRDVSGSIPLGREMVSIKKNLILIDNSILGIAQWIENRLKHKPNVCAREVIGGGLI